MPAALPRASNETAVYRSLSNACQSRVIQSSGSEWIPSTPFDASLLTPEPPFGGSFFGGLRASPRGRGTLPSQPAALATH